MVLEDKPNGFAADALYMASFHGLKGEQFRCPSTSTLRRIAAGQRYDSSLIGLAQQPISSWSCVAMDRIFQPRLKEAPARSPYGCDAGTRCARDGLLLLSAPKKLDDPCAPRRQSIDL